MVTMYNNTTILKKPAIEQANLREHMLKRDLGDQELATYA